MYHQLAAAATIVFAGEDEARIIAPDARDVKEPAAAIASLGPTQVVIKLGVDECFALINGI